MSFSGVTDYGVTVKAEDQGSPSLAGFCTFRVKIGDKNDNPPVFDFPDYETSIEEASPIGKRVLQVRTRQYHLALSVALICLRILLTLNSSHLCKGRNGY